MAYPMTAEYQPPYGGGMMAQPSDLTSGTTYGDYTPPYEMPQMPQLGDSPPPYIGGTGDPNAARAQAPAAPSNYGPYLGWDQGKLNNPTHTTPKYQFLRAMLDAGINSQNRDLTGAVSALQAKGYPVNAVPGSEDKITWGDQGTYDIFNGTNGDFFFGEVGGPQQGAPGGAPMGAGLGARLGASPGSFGGWLGQERSAAGQAPSTASAYDSPLLGARTPTTGAPGMEWGAYQPPYGVPR